MKPSAPANVAGHAAVGCVSAAASGRSCGPAAFAGAAGAFAGPVVASQGFTVGLVATAAVGGTASVIGGGKFGNGALTASFGYLFNTAAAATLSNNSGISSLSPAEASGSPSSTTDAITQSVCAQDSCNIDTGNGDIENADSSQVQQQLADSGITGFTRHGINQIINRGVSPSAILDTVVHPLQILPQANGTVRYIGNSAVVVLNPAGAVVTAWPQ